MIRLLKILAFLCITCLVMTADSVAQTQAKFDWAKAREIYRKSQAGATLSDEESKLLTEAKRLRQMNRANNPNANPGNDPKKNQRSPKAASIGKPFWNLTPLTDFSADQKYKGRAGWLYAQGNQPPEDYLAAATKVAHTIRPLDTNGKPSAEGKVVFLSCGMSNATQEFSFFVQRIRRANGLSRSMVIVDGAIGGKAAGDWAKNIGRGGEKTPWTILMKRIEDAGVTPQQVQTLWLKNAERTPHLIGEMPEHTTKLTEDLELTLRELKRRMPNLKIAYVSTRSYGGYGTSSLNPEPYAYESGFAVKDLVHKSVDAFANGKPIQEMPLLLWGPYFWADGTKGRKIDDLKYVREDYRLDGTHPTDSGRKKIGDLMMDFFRTNASTKPWFLSNE